MQWNINQLLFSEKTQEIVVNGQPQKLESIVSRVLQYFCQNQNKVISREELIQNVWHGQVVTDNAVNRVIAKLRKALNDDVKNSEFITTVPKKGYRLIATATLLTDAPLINSESEHRGYERNCTTKTHYTSFTRERAFSWGIVTLILVSVFSMGWYQFSLPPEHNNLKLKPLTRFKGAELDAALHPEQNWLVYSQFEENILNMYLLNLVTNEPEQVSDGEGNAGGASWSADGSKLVYLYTNEESCQYRIKNFEAGRFSKEQIVYNCPLGSFGKVAFNHAGDSLLFSQRLSPDKPYVIQRLNLRTGQSEQVNQPKTHLGGHRHFDLHPQRNSLLISSPDAQLRLAFYEVNLDKNDFTPLFNKQGYLCCAIWSHDGDHIVMMGPHPASQLEQYDLNGVWDKTIIYSSQTLGPPQRIQNGKDYLFNSGFSNNSLNLLHKSGTSDSLTDANVQEYLPEFSDDGKFLAFISNQSGQEQVWIRNVADSTKFQLSQFDDNNKYFDLRWSPDRKTIALLTVGELRLIDVESSEYRDLLLPQMEIRGLSWVDENHLSFSLKKHNGWRVHHYDIETNSLSLLNNDWRFAQYRSAQDTLLVFTENETILVNGVKAELPIAEPDSRNRRFSSAWIKGVLYYQTYTHSQFQLIALNTSTGESSVVFTNELPFNFTVSDGDTVVSFLDSAEIDIFMSQFY